MAEPASPGHPVPVSPFHFLFPANEAHVQTFRGRRPPSLVTLQALSATSFAPTGRAQQDRRSREWAEAVVKSLDNQRLLDLTSKGRAHIEKAEDEPPLPPSPSWMPGTWPYSAAMEQGGDAGLALPPPLLDETSPPESFDGLLGIRHQEASLARRRLEAHLARDQPPSPPFPWSILAIASKVASVLGTPSEAWDTAEVKRARRRKDDARALRGLEIGERWAGQLAVRFRRRMARSQTLPAEVGLVPASHPALAPDSRRLSPPPALAPASLFTGYGSPVRSSADGTPLMHASPSLSRPRSPAASSPPRPPAPRLVPIWTSLPSSPFGSFRSLASLLPHSSALFSPLILDEVVEESPVDTRMQHALAKSSSDNSSPARDGSAAGDAQSVLSDDASMPDDDYFKPKMRRRRPHPPPAMSAQSTRPEVEPPPPKAITTPQRLLDAFIVFLLGPPQAYADSLISTEGLVGLLLGGLGFGCFVAVHTVTLAIEMMRFLRSVILTVCWMWANLSGRTDLGKVARRYY